MHVSKLILHDFRSYASVEIEIEPGATAFIGSNGQGKTNLVEAIDYLSRLDSHRVSNDTPLVRAGAQQAIVRADVVKGDRTALARLFDQEAGRLVAIARRIVPWSEVGDTVPKGFRFGMIRFGSRTEVYLPLSAEVTVKVGDKVKGAETIIAKLI